ncbi:MAG: hypothetical protein ACKO85_15565, partial [Isosphaeraceae bacterium]
MPRIPPSPDQLSLFSSDSLQSENAIHSNAGKGHALQNSHLRTDSGAEAALPAPSANQATHENDQPPVRGVEATPPRLDLGPERAEPGTTGQSHLVSGLRAGTTGNPDSFALRIQRERSQCGSSRTGNPAASKSFVEKIRPGRGQQRLFDPLDEISFPDSNLTSKINATSEIKPDPSNRPSTTDPSSIETSPAKPETNYTIASSVKE